MTLVELQAELERLRDENGIDPHDEVVIDEGPLGVALAVGIVEDDNGKRLLITSRDYAAEIQTGRARA